MQGIESFLSQVRSGQVDPYFFVSHASADNAEIRPVIEVLLEAGIPLWFDRPRDMGLDPEQFVGSLSPNERWTTQLNEALAWARGLIWFPSANYSVSDECKRELACADMLTLIMPEFEVAPICISGQAFQDMGLREQTRQATRAFVTGTGEIEDTYKSELGDLAQLLRDRLADTIRYRDTMVAKAMAFAAEEQSVQSSPDKLRDYTVPYRVNRTNQRHAAREMHDEYREGVSNRRPILVCHGELEDVSRQFVSTTLAERLVAETGRLFEWKEQTGQLIRPTWPTCPPNEQDRFSRRFRDSLFEKFLGADNDTGRRSPTEALAESFANDRCTRIIASRLDLGRKEKGFKSLQNVLDHIQAWATFWDQFPFELADTETFLSLIPVLEIVYDPDAQRGGLFRRASTSVQFEKFAEDSRKSSDFNRTFSQVEVQFLERFDKITPGWVEDWIDDDGKLFSHLNEQKKQKLRDLLETEFNGNDHLPMKSWSSKAAPVLEDWRIGIEGN